VFGLDRIRFYENGVVSCNLPFDGQTLQARATRSTHPKLLRLLSALLTELLDKKFTIENPYFGRTRTEVCERLGELQHQWQIGQTRSCARCIYRHPANHCGTCSQCIDRRFATLAAKCGESDPDWLYALNIFTDALEKPEDRAMALGYIGFARSVENMTVNEFIKRFGSEAFEIGRHLGTDSTEVAVRSLFFLHERHAKGVNRVMVEKMAQNTSATYHGTLPETCLLSMVSAQKHIECRRRPAASTRRKHAREALDLRVARCLKGRTNPTAQQVADSIGNTTADAVRQTKAWKSRPGKRRK